MVAIFNNVGNKLSNALLGSTQITPYNSTGTQQYPDDLQKYLDSLENQPYMQNLLNQPKQTGLSLDQYKQGIAQGLNFGVPEIAEAQNNLKINIPKTGEEIDLAKIGDFNTYPISAGLSSSKHKNGFFEDVAKGYDDNYSNRFNVNNLMPEQNKGFAVRLGEGLGSLGRFIDSPLGRGLLAAGLNKALGYDDSLQEGLQAYIGRQNALTADDIYRTSLQNAGIDVSNIRGNVGSDVYKNLIANTYKFRNLDQNTYTKLRTLYDRQLQQGVLTPEEYTANIEALNNQYVNSQIQTMQAGNVGISNQTRNTNMNEQLLPYKQYALQVSPQVALGNLGVAQGNLALRQAELPYDVAYKQMQIENFKNKNNSDKSTLKALTENNATLADIDAGIQAITENPSAYSWIKGKVGADIANRIDPKGVGTRTQIDNITAVYRKWLTGAQMSDQERKAYERFLPAPTDNAQIVKAKLQGMKSSIERKNQAMMQGIQPTQAQANSNPLGLNL